MRCDRLSAKLADASLDGSVLDEPVTAHVRQCLRCQAELARSRRLARSLHALHQDVVVPSASLLPAILATIETLPTADPDTGADSSRVRRVVTIGGIAAATAAGAAAGAIVLATRSRRLSA